MLNNIKLKFADYEFYHKFCMSLKLGIFKSNIVNDQKHTYTCNTYTML